jgi:hypothetical protein
VADHRIAPRTPCWISDVVRLASEANVLTGSAIGRESRIVLPVDNGLL